LRRVLTALALFAVGYAASFEAHAQSKSGEFKPRAKHTLLMDAASGGIMFRHNADELVAPASMSKLMTIAIVFKQLKSGKLKLEDELQMSVNAWRRGGAPSRTSSMFVPVHNKVSVSELLQGMIVQSANDAAICIAEAIGGNEAAFAKLMTAEARRIGLRKSQFRNASGLPHPEHLMTVTEIAQLARHIMLEYPEYFPMFAQREFKYRRHRFINRNPLLADTGVDGMKTGHLKDSGYGIVVSAKLNGRPTIAVVHGATSEAQRRDEARRLLDWGSKSIAPFTVFEAGEIVGRARVWGGSAFYVPLVGKGEVQVWLPKFPPGQRLKGEIIYASPLKAPIKRGDEVARLRVTSSSNAVQEVKLHAADDVEESGMVRRGLDSLAHLAFGWLPL
jgi:D-alanyl-D-alanine carboxypeptidase (penicillin-binding protein 5/6)